MVDTVGYRNLDFSLVVGCLSSLHFLKRREQSAHHLSQELAFGHSGYCNEDYRSKDTAGYGRSELGQELAFVRHRH